MQIPRADSPFAHAADSDFTVIRPELTVDGITYKMGDKLRADASLRNMPRRLEVLCKHRVLAPVLAPAAKASPTKESKTSRGKTKLETKPDYASMKRIELRRLLKKRGLDHLGNRNALTARLVESDND